MTDTIFALASAPGRAGIAVIRISGPDTARTLEAVMQNAPPEPRRAALRRFFSPEGGVIDRGLVLWFPAPASFTGEDCAELHVHGGPAVVEAMAGALVATGLRLAQPGEFTRRAFGNGRMDLTEAEGLADLVDAETEGQRAQALAQMTGALRTLYEGWRAELLSVLAAIEGEIDFPDEDDVPGALSQAARAPLDRLIEALGAHLDDRRGERVRDGFSVAIIGAPNAGKSTLLNRLAGREAAIVTDIPGTTRDVVEVRLVLGGFPVIVADTAGLREAADRVEAEGVRRALERARNADLRIAVVDVSRETFGTGVAALVRTGDLLALNKSDLAPAPAMDTPQGVRTFALSAESGAGVEALVRALEETVAGRLSGREAPALSRARHRQNVSSALEHLVRAREALASAPELAGADVHLALRALESLTGRVDVEDVLDQVFSQFCIGK